MIEKKVVIANKAGIHCRPSSVILTVVQRYPGHQFEVTAPNGSTDLTSILGLLALGIQYGDTVTLRCTGPDEERVAADLIDHFVKEYDFPPR